MEQGTKQNVSELLKKPYLTETEVSVLTGRALSTLRNERFLRKGFPYLRISERSIRYKTADIVEAMERNRIAFDE
jgi:hypothetical protein